MNAPLQSEQLHTYLRAPGSKEQVRVGPFLAAFTPGVDHPMLNHAVPDDGARPSPAEVDAFVEVFRARGLKPRLEYLEQPAPDVEAALVRAGFVVEKRFPVLVCGAGDLVGQPVPTGFAVARAETDRDHADAIVIADEAYGEPPSVPDARVIAARQAMSADGGAVVLAREHGTGAPAASGLFPAPSAGVSELAAVGTGPVFRRRGLAAAVTATLAGIAFDGGVDLLWLTPEHDEGERIYTRVGFHRLDSTMIHSSLTG